jgi:hypothetical protein
MTLKQAILKRLYDHGLFEDQAQAVFDLMIVAPENKEMADRWNDMVEDYPPAIYALAWMSAKQCAVQWIDANKPKHWARPVFAS